MKWFVIPEHFCRGSSPYKIMLEAHLKEGLTFDDVLLLPRESSVLPRDVDVGTNLTSKIKLNIPIVSSAMDTVTESATAIALAREGGMGFIHKNMSIEKQVEEVLKVLKERLPVGGAVGTGDKEFERAVALVNAGVDCIAVDTAHGHSKNVILMIKRLKEKFPSIQIVAGNIATAAAANSLIEAGADALKVGIGPGSICTTRIIAGVGVPQITAIADVAKVAREKNIPVIADGGIKYSGDIVKALAAGANVVMIGQLFAGTDESPGETLLFEGRSYKSYRGMGSLPAMQKGSKDRYSQGDVNEVGKLVPEGIEGRVLHRGKLSQVIHQLVGGLRSGMGYLGCRTIEELYERSEFIKITRAGLYESHVHDVVITKEAPNY